MLNTLQSSLVMSPQQSSTDLLMNNEQTDSTADTSAKGAEELFAVMLLGMVENGVLPEDNTMHINIEALVSADPNLKDAIPQDLLMQFLESGGENGQALENFLEQLTGHEIDLNQMLAKNLNQVTEILEQQGINTQAIIETIDPRLLNKQTLAIESSKEKGTLELSFVDLPKNSVQQSSIVQLPQQLQKELRLQTNLVQNPAVELSQNVEKSAVDLLNTIDKNFLQENFSDKSGQFLEKLQSMIAKNTISTSTNATVPATAMPSTMPFTPASAESPILVRSLQVNAPVTQGEWGQQFNDQILWLGSQQVKAASIKLNPAELGPVEVNIKVRNDIASIQFNSHSGQVRELIEQALPRLKEMMNEQGLQLADVDVQDNSQQQAMKKQNTSGFSKGSENGTQDFFEQLNTEEGDEIADVTSSALVQRLSRGLVDYFA